MTHDLDGLGYKRICCRSDNDAGLCKLLRLLKERWAGELILEQTPEGDHNANGSAECSVGLMKGHVRSVKIALEEKIGCEIPATHNLMTWVVAFARSSYRKYHIGKDGRSPMERVFGRTPNGPAAHFGEAVWWKPLSPSSRPGALEERFQDGYFAGHVDGTTQYYVLTPTGAVRCRTICRKPDGEK